MARRVKPKRRKLSEAEEKRIDRALWGIAFNYGQFKNVTRGQIYSIRQAMDEIKEVIGGMFDG